MSSGKRLLQGVAVGLGVWAITRLITQPKGLFKTEASQSVAVQKGQVQEAPLQSVLNQIESTGAVGSPTRSTRAGVDFINREIFNIVPSRRVTVPRMIGESKSAFIQRHRQTIAEVTRQFALDNGGIAQISIDTAARAEANRGTKAQAIAPSLDFGAFARIVSRAGSRGLRFRAERQAASARNKNNVDRSANNTRRDLLREVNHAFTAIRKANASGDRSAAIIEEARFQKQLARDEINKLLRL